MMCSVLNVASGSHLAGITVTIILLVPHVSSRGVATLQDEVHIESRERDREVHTALLIVAVVGVRSRRVDRVVEHNVGRTHEPSAH
jgi:hypothetical protein